MTCTITLFLLLLTSVLQLTAIIMIFSYHRELKQQGMASGEAWKTMMVIATMMQEAVQDHGPRIKKLEDARQQAS